VIKISVAAVKAKSVVTPHLFKQISNISQRIIRFIKAWSLAYPNSLNLVHIRLTTNASAVNVKEKDVCTNVKKASEAGTSRCFPERSQIR
jgi:hypothetical protein